VSQQKMMQQALTDGHVKRTGDTECDLMAAYTHVRKALHNAKPR
jgi:hypothetical protein